MSFNPVRSSHCSEPKNGITDCISGTQNIHAFKFQHGEKEFLLVDTPGFDDTYRSDSDVFKEIANWLFASYRDGAKISGIVYLHPISKPRMEGSALRSLRMFRELCGEEFMSNVILGTTFWDVVGEEIGATREEELLQTEGFFKDMKSRGCDVVRISQNREANLELLSRFAAKQPTVMRIQQELFEGKSVTETAAASAISQELVELQRQHIDKLADFEHQKQRTMTKFSLEMAYTRKLGQRAFSETIIDLNAQQDKVRRQGEEQEKVSSERLATIQAQRDRQNQKYQVDENELSERLRTLRAKTSC